MRMIIKNAVVIFFKKSVFDFIRKNLEICYYTFKNIK